jgi:hypothetical protein
VVEGLGQQFFVLLQVLPASERFGCRGSKNIFSCESVAATPIAGPRLFPSRSGLAFGRQRFRGPLPVVRKVPVLQPARYTLQLLQGLALSPLQQLALALT